MRTMLIAFLLAAGAQDSGKKKVICTLPVLKSIADELGGGEFEVTALSKPDQDPHSVSPTPALMKRLREADLFIEIGLQLELWAEEVAGGSGNPRVQRGQAGRVIASAGIPREDVPKVVDRSLGDVHPEGNPHLWLDPMRAKALAGNIAAAMKGAAVDARLKKFVDRVDEAMFGPELLKEVGSRTLARKAADGTLWAWIEERKLSDKAGGWLRKAAPLRGQKVIEHHRVWIYFAKAMGFEIVGSIEEKPGIQPAARHLRELETRIREEKVKLIIVDNFYDVSYARSLAEKTGIKVAVVPNQPGGDYVTFIDQVLDMMLEAAR